MPNDINIRHIKMKASLNSCNSHRKRRRFTESEKEKEGDLGFLQDIYLPEWFLIEIFCRLPVKIIFRFKCVSKQWLSILSDPFFPSFYISRALPLSVPRCPWFLISEKMHVEDSKMSYPPECNMFEGNLPANLCTGNLASPDFYNVIPLPTRHKAKENDIYNIKAIDNGFLLYCLFEYHPYSETHIGGYYICNPITKQWLALPATAPEYLDRRISVGFVTQVEAGQLTSYKVVLVNCPKYKKRKFLEFYIFSSATGEWEESRVYCELEILLCHRKAVVLNLTLHWIEFEYGIVAYNPYNTPDKFRIIPFPPGYSKADTKSYCTECDVHQGHLKYFEVTGVVERILRPQDTSIKIWELKDYSSGHWCLQHTVRLEDVIAAANFVIPYIGLIKLIGFHPHDPDVVYLEWNCIHVVSYNIQTRRLEKIVYKGCKFPNVSVLLLLHPLWPISIAPSLLNVHYSRS